MAAPLPKHETRDGPAPAAAAAGGRGGGGLGALRRQIELEDRRLQAAAFFIFWGACVVLNGAALNGSTANPEHLLAGYTLFTIGVALAVLMLACAGAGRLGRAAARLEEALRGFFC